MDKWLIKRDFSIPPKLLKGSLLEALKDKPIEQAFFWKMWNDCTQIVQDVLSTDYFKGIKENSLHPKAFGTLMVQDA